MLKSIPLAKLHYNRKLKMHNMQWDVRYKCLSYVDYSNDQFDMLAAAENNWLHFAELVTDKLR